MFVRGSGARRRASTNRWNYDYADFADRSWGRARRVAARGSIRVIRVIREIVVPTVTSRNDLGASGARSSCLLAPGCLVGRLVRGSGARRRASTNRWNYDYADFADGDYRRSGTRCEWRLAVVHPRQQQLNRRAPPRHSTGRGPAQAVTTLRALRGRSFRQAPPRALRPCRPEPVPRGSSLWFKALERLAIEDRHFTLAGGARSVIVASRISRIVPGGGRSARLPEAVSASSASSASSARSSFPPLRAGTTFRAGGPSLALAVVPCGSIAVEQQVNHRELPRHSAARDRARATGGWGVG